jgi:hypothetical protein
MCNLSRIFVKFGNKKLVLLYLNFSAQAYHIKQNASQTEKNDLLNIGEKKV